MHVHLSDSFFAFLAASGPARDWSLGFEGISPGWAFLIFLLIALGTLFAYWKFAPVSRWRKGVMVFLRIAAALVLVTLLAKPVLNLTIHDPVRQPLAVLVDNSESLRFEDRRANPDDVKRAAIAAGRIDAKDGLNQSVPGDAAKDLTNISRPDLLQ